MSMPDDLDQLEAHFKHWQNPSVGSPIEVQLASEGLALVAELRAAREIVEEARAWSLPANAEIMPYAAQRDFRELVTAYDEARHANA
jgi:hypothetical protein